MDELFEKLHEQRLKWNQLIWECNWIIGQLTNMRDDKVTDSVIQKHISFTVSINILIEKLNMMLNSGIIVEKDIKSTASEIMVMVEDHHHFLMHEMKNAFIVRKVDI
jgi:hypothetical protein